jgi:hypothetical protein
MSLATVLAFGLARGSLQAQAPLDDDERWRGIVTAMPATGFVGQWTIGGRTVIADNSTRIHQEDAPLQIGGCAEVRLDDDADDAAEEIKGKVARECNQGGTQTPDASTTPGSTGTPTPTRTPTPDDDDHDDDDHDDDDHDDRYGRVEEMPATGLVGRWVIDGTPYTTTLSTEFDADHGAFAVGVCVEVELEGRNPARVEELETERDFKCSSRQPQGLLFGVIDSFPAGLIGTWQIGGLTFIADTTTSFQPKRGSFAGGVTVKVKFFEDESGVNRAIEIETKFKNDDNGRDDDNNGSHDGEDGHAYGIIDSYPAQLVGVWIISGEPYTATTATEFEQDDGIFAQGARVRVEFFLDAAGNKIADEIETTDDNGEVDDNNHAKLVGYVESVPVTGFVGNWRVGGVALVAEETTKFKERHGLLAVGAYVTVEYFTVNGVKRIHEIETQVPPGAGDDLAIGIVEALDDNRVSAADGTAQRTWRVGGVVYTVNAATDINEALSPLTVGGTAVVNSYPAADGTPVATRIQGIVLDEALYLPVMKR